MGNRPDRVPLVLFAFLAAVLLPALPGTGSAFRNLEQGAPAIPFTLRDVGGKDVEFKPPTGKVTVLSFVDLAQDRSREQLKDLVSLREELGGEGVDFLAVAKYTNTAEEARKTAEALGITFPILLDKDQKAYGEYGLYVLPSAGVVGKDGTFVFEHAGHGADFRDVLGGKVKVLAGRMTEAEYRKRITPVESARKSGAQTEADRLLALGRTLRERGMHDRAAEKFARAVELDPGNPDGCLSYGEALVEMKKYDEALAQFRKAKELVPSSKEAQLGIGTVYLERGETEKAIAEITEAATLNPKPEKAYYRLGAAYEKKGDLPSAVKYYRKALDRLFRD